MDNTMKDVQGEIISKKYMKPNDRTVSNGGYDDLEHKQRILKDIAIALAHQGYSKVKIAKEVGIERKTLYNWINSDTEFAKALKYASVLELQVKAATTLHQKIAEGDVSAAKYALDKTGYWEQRLDVGSSDVMIQNPNTGVFESAKDSASVANMIAERYEMESGASIEETLRLADIKMEKQNEEEREEE